MKFFTEREFLLNGLHEGLHFSDSSYALLKAKEYGPYTIALIKQAKEKIFFQSMNFENDHMVGIIFNLLCEKAREGLDVRLNIDGFSHMVTDGNIDVFPSISKNEREFRRFRRQTKRQILHKLKVEGVRITETNWPVSNFRHIFPPVGRNHIKLAIIDDKGFLGGINLSDKDFLREDTMLQISDRRIVQGLIQAFEISITEGYHDSQILARISDTDLLFDGNKRSSSLILSKAEEIALSARESITICTQFAPDSFLISLIDQIDKQNVDVKLIVSQPKFITEQNAALFDLIDRTIARLRGVEMQLFPGWLHAKLMLIDANTTTEKALYGTHNFVEKGSRWGNEELALYTENPFLLKELRAYVAKINKQMEGE